MRREPHLIDLMCDCHEGRLPRKGRPPAASRRSRDWDTPTGTERTAEHVTPAAAARSQCLGGAGWPNQAASTPGPFANLPDDKKSRWGAGITAEEMHQMHWTRPQLVGQIRFVEFTADGRLRHWRCAPTKRRER